MSFERFTRTGRGYKPKVSVTKNGMIGFNQGSVQRFKLEDYQYAILYFDKENKRIGVELSNDENEEGVCKLRQRTSGADVSAKAFFDFYGIGYSSTTRYDAVWDDGEKRIIICLEDE